MKRAQTMFLALAAGLALAVTAVALFRQYRPTKPLRDPMARPGALTLPLQSEALRPFTLKDEDKRPASTLYTLTHGDRVLKVEVFLGLEPEAADRLREDGIMNLEALYANALSPYPGDLSHQVTADPRLRPQFVRRTVGPVSYSYFLLFANERLGYGATTGDAVKFKSLLGWFYCAGRREFYKVRLFAPLTTEHRELETLFLSLNCR